MRRSISVTLAVFLLLAQTMSVWARHQTAKQMDDPARLLEEARRLQRAGQLLEAETTYRRLVALRPGTPEPYLTASRFFEQTGRIADAAEMLREGLARLPESLPLIKELGFVYAAMEDYQRAAQFFARARDMDPGDQDNTFNFANASLKAAGVAFAQERWDECLAAVRQALDTGQALPRLNYMAGMAYYRKLETQKAIAFLAKAIEEEPEFWQAHVDFGLALAADSQWSEARNHFSRALELNPAFAPAYLYLGRALHETNQSEQSVLQFEKALELDPHLALAHFHLGFALKGLTQYVRARKELLAELQINPNYAPAYYELGLIALEMGTDEEAMKFFRETLSRDKRFSKAHYEAAKLLFKNQDYIQAIEDYLAFLELEPRSAEGYFGLSRALQRAGRNAEAAKALEIYKELTEAQRPKPQ